ncbi:phage tail protein [Lactobacillus rhamnosus]|uniref:Phage tail protein n=1 Tax=Lacticaseibacillus rhamnosus TaxID=47715 RepID=A0A7Y7QH20_LACRH|nr:phage tail protein [Lacticaseibacillus rhamnosus]NVO88949.1 phage tail protein [Lacticaseibacillus rhamnosus]
MADDFSSQLDNWMDSVTSSMTLTAADKAKVTGAGAEAYSRILHDQTPVSTDDYHIGRSAGHANAKHHNAHRKTKHLRDSITYEDGYTADNLQTGDTDVGWDGHYYDFLARIINDGKHKMSAKQMSEMHFMDRAQSAARDAVAEAMAKAYKEVQGGQT